MIYCMIYTEPGFALRRHSSAPALRIKEHQIRLPQQVARARCILRLPLALRLARLVIVLDLVRTKPVGAVPREGCLKVVSTA